MMEGHCRPFSGPELAVRFGREGIREISRRVELRLQEEL